MAPATDALLATTKARRTMYKLSNESTIPDSRIEEIVKHAILHVPSAFNTQATRIIVLLKKEHEKLWDITTNVVKPHVPEAAWSSSTGPKMAGLKAAYGTILFYEDPTHIEPMKEKFKLYADKFEEWTDQSNGMHQYLIWTALEAEGMGCNIQHYNPLINESVSKEWNIPAGWALKGQMVFGKPTEMPGPKQFQPAEERYKVFGA